jgi:glycosyltransferase involved in cell wall biosynthesis
MISNRSRRRVAIHDFAGFAFPVQLGRELARRGHHVKLLYSDLDMRGGRLSRGECDPKTFSVSEVSIGQPFRKHELLRRAGQEFAYARALGREIARFAPEVLLNTNGTMIMSLWLRRCAVAQGCAYVHWMQDIHTHTIGYVLRRRFGRLGELGRGLIRLIERDVVANAAATIVISDDFKAQLAAYGMHPRAVFSIPNWMPCEEITPLPKDNEFARAFGLAHTFNVVYTGVLGHKHDIAPFVALARTCRDLDDLRIVIVGRGFGVERLRQAQQTYGLANLVLIDWQPHERFPDVLATGDLLMAVLTPQASPSSVPSKILAYLCAGRAVLAVMPEDNLARRLVEGAGAGVGMDPGDHTRLVALVRAFHATPQDLTELAGRARRYAESNFAIDPIADRFEAIIDDVATRRVPNIVELDARPSG